MALDPNEIENLEELTTDADRTLMDVNHADVTYKVVYKKTVVKATESNAIKRSSYYDGEHEAVSYTHLDVYKRQGKGYRRKNNSFKRNIGDGTYIFDENGKMLSGWFDEDGNPIEDSDSPFVEGVYYAREDGRILTGEWLDYGEIDEGIGGSDLDLSLIHI